MSVFLSPSRVFRPRRTFQTALLASVSALTLLAAGAPAEARNILAADGAASAAANAAAGAVMSAQQAAAATQQSMNSLARATQAIQAMQAAQGAARNLALSAPSTVPNGLGAGGLQVAPNVGTDPSLWQNANLPTQATSGGQTTVTVKQTAQKAILTWAQFNVGKDTTVHFDQTAGNSSAGNNWIALNRIVDPSGVPSQILGQIKAEGSVYILNRNGVIFGGSSQVNTNTLLVTSLPFMGEPVNLASMVPGSAAYDAAVQASNNAFLTVGITGPGNNGAPFLGSGGVSVAGASLSDVQSYGNITIDAGAQIQAGSLGYAMFAAPNVANAGTIQAADGQVILAAGMGVQLVASTGVSGNSWLSPVLLGAVDSPGQPDQTPVFAATNTGLIQATTGNVTMLGATVTQAGVIAVTTSIARPGAIVLSAVDESTGGSITYAARTGPLVLAPGSVTTVLPDEDGETTTSTQAANASFHSGTISLIGGAVTFTNGSLVEAPGAGVSVVAQLPVSSPVSINGDVVGRVYVDRGAVIDVSGLPDVQLPVSATLVTIGPLTADDLADAPLQRNGFLFTRKVVLDSTISGTRADGERWVGSPLINAQGYVDEMPRTIDQMLVNGGTLNLAGGEVITAPGSVLNLTGGYIHYLGGAIATTRLVDAAGHLVDIAEADPNDTFVGIAGQFTVDHAHWGIKETYGNLLLSGTTTVPDYIQGGSGGALNVFASAETTGATILDGEILASSEAGLHQVQGGDVPKGGSLSVGDTSLAGGVNPFAAVQGNAPSTTQSIVIADRGTQLDAIAPGFNADTSLLTPAYQALSQSDPSNILYTSTLSAPILDAAGFSAMSFNATTNLAVNAPLKVRPGGSISLTGGAVQVNANLTAPGGTISITGKSYILGTSSTGATPDLLFPGDVTVGSGVTLSAAGQWVNDAGLGLSQQTGAATINGGSISIITQGNSDGPQGVDSLPASDVTGAIDLKPGSVLDVSSGGYVQPNGVLEAVDGIPVGKGGSISLETYVFSGGFGNYGTPPLPQSQPTHGTITLGGALRGFGFSGGGTLTLQTLDIQIGGDPASAPSYALVLPASFFSSQGFGAYNLTALYDATVTAGTTVTVSERNLIPNLPGLLAAPTGTKLYGAGGARPDGSLVSVGSLDPYHRQAANFSLTAAGYMGWSTTNGAGGNFTISPPVYAGVTGTLLLGQGAAILADPGAAVSLTSYDQLTDLGTIVAHGGSISLTGAAADSTPATSSVWLGAASVLDASGTTLLDPAATPVWTASGQIVPRTGKVLAGGSVSVLDGSSYVIAQAGSVIDVSGAAGTFDLAGSPGEVEGHAYAPTPVWSNAGSITLGGGGGLLYDGTLIAHGGAAQASGGTLTLSAANMGTLYTQRNLEGTATPRASGIILQQSGTFVPAGLRPGQAIAGNPYGFERFAVDRLDGSGIASLVVGADPVAVADASLGPSLSSPTNVAVAVGFAGNVSIGLGRSFVSDATEYVALPAGATAIPTLAAGLTSVGGTRVSIVAPYVDFGGAASATPVLATADGTLAVRAGTLDLTGQIGLANFGTATFASTGDTRLYSLVYSQTAIPT
ncbi:beta strand repeat-containing protein, partial [Aliidongia dinghuensis]|uniref:beta strand repeat-containing protein n=1 Tax=Aliidongia dinghuensis TaxID=1867774 RepID=UPI0016647C6C